MHAEYARHCSTLMVIYIICYHFATIVSQQRANSPNLVDGASH